MRKAFILLLLLTGCATSASRLTHLYQGMPESEVVQELGEPDHKRGDGALVYKLDDGGMLASDYYVYMKGGKCVGWERAGGAIDYQARQRAAESLQRSAETLNRQNASEPARSCQTTPDGLGGFHTSCF